MPEGVKGKRAEAIPSQEPMMRHGECQAICPDCLAQRVCLAGLKPITDMVSAAHDSVLILRHPTNPPHSRELVDGLVVSCCFMNMICFKNVTEEIIELCNHLVHGQIPVRFFVFLRSTQKTTHSLALAGCISWSSANIVDSAKSWRAAVAGPWLPWLLFVNSLTK